MKNKRASILMVSLWVLAILVLFAVGLGYRAAINLRLGKYQVERVKLSLLAEAGINYAVSELEKDEPACDSLSDAWVDDEKLFSKLMLNEHEREFAQVSYLDEQGNKKFGMVDEERKLNLNSTFKQKELLEQLFIARATDGNPEDLAKTLVEWINAAEEPDEKKKVFKNDFLKTPEELISIFEYFYQDKLQAQKNFKQIEDIITVYNVWDYKINVNTATSEVLNIFTTALAQNQQESQEAGGLVEEIVNLRNSRSEPFCQEADINLDLTAASADKINLFHRLKENIIFQSGNFKIQSLSRINGVSKNIFAVYSRCNKKIVYWQEN